MKGLFVTFEGIDGSGKSTQISMLSEDLEKAGIPYVLIREPGATSIGEKIRTILLDKENSKMHARTELLLYEAARAQIVEERIRPELTDGKVVICDRFYDSTVAYQGYARGLALDAIEYLNNWSTGDLAPDITFLFDLPAEEACRRRNLREGAEDRLEAEGLSFMQKVRDGYLDLSRREARIRVLSAMDTPDMIYRQVQHAVWEVLGR